MPQPMGRLGNPAGIATAVLYLASDAAFRSRLGHQRQIVTQA
jgi:NAD(P)-dependent dehydrogenase (short-subunit alcohol dehydrogenase family)